jgi:hypothetical protein
VREAAAAEPLSRSPRTGLKAAAASVAAVVAMSSGVAFATTGHVPFAGALKQVTRQVTGQGSDGHPDGTHGRTTDGESQSPNGPKAAALHGLCRAYARGQKATHGHALEARPFTGLVLAAGGADQIETFCGSLPPQAHDGATHPSHPTHPTTGPSDGPTPSEPGGTHATDPTHPTKPTHTSQPTHKPKPSHPTQPTHSPKPTDKPSHTAKPHPTR